MSFHESSGLPASVNEVGNGQPRVSQKHSWARVPHHSPDTLSSDLLIAVYFAVQASRFLGEQRAFIDSPEGVVGEFLAVGAQPSSSIMAMNAVHFDHRFDGLLLPCCSGTPLFPDHQMHSAALYRRRFYILKARRLRRNPSSLESRQD
jgi:hypothetical protein